MFQQLNLNTGRSYSLFFYPLLLHIIVIPTTARQLAEKTDIVPATIVMYEKRGKPKANIAAQTRNLREADGIIQQFIKGNLQKLDEDRKNNMIAFMT